MAATILYLEPIYTSEPFDEQIFGPDATIHKLHVEHIPDVPAEIREEVDGLMLFRHFLSEREIALFPRLKAIVRLGVGYDRIDLRAAAARNITVCNVPDYGTAEVADHAIALCLGLCRGVFLHHDRQRGDTPKAWQSVDHPLLRRLSASRFGIVGLGRIGTTAALRAKAFGCDVVFYDPYLPSGCEIALGIRRTNSLEELLAQADILSLHTPLTEETRGLIGAAEIGLMPPGSLIINTSRGPVLDLEAVYDGLVSGHLAGAGLDVVAVEPPREPLPALIRAYRAGEEWTIGRVVITPHVAYCSPQASRDLHRKAVETMHSVLSGQGSRNIVSAA